MLQHHFAIIRLRLHQALIDDDRRVFLFPEFGNRGLQGGSNLRG